MNGVLLVNKPKDYTSRDIVNIVGKKLGTKKIGHTGTLDPMAEGILILCVGSYTKLVDSIMCTYKEYVAEITLGISTDTLDITGKILEEKSIVKTHEEIEKVLSSFIGKYNQEAPIYSAIKVNGKKLYDYARNNQEVTLPIREVDIKSIELLEVNSDSKRTTFKIKTTVSKGTYIRSLARDIATKLGTVGCMSSLIRTKQGKFNIEDCYCLNDIENGDYKLLKIEDIFDYPVIEMDEDLDKLISNGVPVQNIYNEEYIIFKSKRTLAIYKDDSGLLKMYKKIIDF